MLAAALAAELIAGAVVIAPVTARPAQRAEVTVADDRRMVPVSLGGALTDDLLARVGAELGGAVTAVERFWGADWTRDIVVVATGSEAQFTAEAGLDPARPWADIAAVTVARDVDPARRMTSGQRIVLAPGASSMSDSALRIVVTHELFHLAARADTAVDAPRWLTEGVADFVARDPGPLPPGAAADTQLPSDVALDTEGGQRSAAYDRAWWFARFVADTYGDDGLLRLYRSVCGPGRTDLADTLGPALGTDLQTLRSSWARWLERGGSADDVSGNGANPSGHQ